MTAAEIARALGGAKRHGVEWDARCPAHDDASPSLSLRDGDDGKILFRCHAGCSQQQVFDALLARGLLESAPMDTTILAPSRSRRGKTGKTMTGARSFRRPSRRTSRSSC